MYAAIAVGVIIIGMSIFFVYSSEQAKTRGQAFGKAIEFLQEDLRKQTHMFDSKVSMFKRGDIEKDEFNDPLLHSARILIEIPCLSSEDILNLYASTGRQINHVFDTDTHSLVVNLSRRSRTSF